jgi:hypothetical protein
MPGRWKPCEDPMAKQQGSRRQKDIARVLRDRKRLPSEKIRKGKKEGKK